jgi:hypothetical protein
MANSGPVHMYVFEKCYSVYKAMPRITVPVARGVVQSLENARKRRWRVIGGKLPHYSIRGMDA